VITAHDEGIIHVHDLDYIAEPMHNCCLVNLADMLQNGTVVSGTMIEKPHSFSTACNIATQIIAQVASNQYGGQTVSLAHLAPFVDVSRQKIRAEVFEDVNCDCSAKLSEEEINHIVEKRVRREVKRGVQTIQYQINTLLTTNGQTPFVTVFMYLDEVPEGQTRDDLAMIIEETLLQRIEGVKNEKGVWITPAFPYMVGAA
jgi:ribonucleoside-triphosphate reductase